MPKSLEIKNNKNQQYEIKDLANYYQAKELKKMDGETFKKGQRAKMLKSLEIGIYKDLRVDPMDGLLIGTVNDKYNSDEAKAKYKDDKLAMRIINEDIADNEAISEAMEADESYWNSRNNF